MDPITIETINYQVESNAAVKVELRSEAAIVSCQGIVLVVDSIHIS